MHAIIMAGGEGKRLRPLTCTMPKPMVPLLGRPMIDYCAALLHKHGIEDVTATLCYMPDVIREHLGDGSAFGLNMRYTQECRPMGTAGSVRAAAGEETDQTIVLSGDALTDIDISSALRFHQTQNAKVTIVLTRVDAPTEYGVVLLGEDLRVLRFFEKPQPDEVYSNLANTGIYILEPGIIERIPKDTKFDFSNDLFPRLLQGGEAMYGFVTKDYWCDIGSLSTYIQAQMDLLDGKCESELIPKGENGIFVEDGVQLSKDALLTPPCYLCRDTQIAAGSRIGPYSVIGAKSRIGAYSSVKHSVLMSDVRLRENVELRGCVICEGAHVENHGSIFDGAAIGAQAWLEEGVTIRPGIRVWPQRRVVQGSVCSSDVVWNSGAPHEITKGYADQDMTPNYASSIAAAFASILAPLFPATIAVADDGTQQSVMLKSAVVAGLLSQGADVCDFGYISPDALTFGLVETDCAGGVYVEAGEKAQMCSILLFDESGTEIGGDRLRKLAQALTESLRPVTARRLGLLSTNDVQMSYDAHISRSMEKEKIDGTIVLCAPDCVFDTVARVHSRRSIKTLLSRADKTETLIADMMCSGAQLACMVKDFEISELYFEQQSLNSSMRRTVLMLSKLQSGKQSEFLVPLDIPEAYAELLRNKGASIKRVGARKGKWRKESIAAHCYDPALFETETEIVRFSEMALSGELKKLLSLLPQTAVRGEKIACPWRDMGRIMRGLVETENLKNAELIEGIRVKKPEGWVLVRAEGMHAYRVIAESMRAEYAQDLCELYVKKIQSAIDEKK